jgi:hypothetical protein
MPDTVTAHKAPHILLYFVALRVALRVDDRTTVSVPNQRP